MRINLELGLHQGKRSGILPAERPNRGLPMVISASDLHLEQVQRAVSSLVPIVPRIVPRWSIRSSLGHPCTFHDCEIGPSGPPFRNDRHVIFAVAAEFCAYFFRVVSAHSDQNCHASSPLHQIRSIKILN